MYMGIAGLKTQKSNQHPGLLDNQPAGLAALALATGMQAVATHPGLVALVPASLQAEKEMCGRLSHTYVESLLEDREVNNLAMACERTRH